MTPHAVYGPDQSIVLGHHMICIGSLRQTLLGFIHCLMRGEAITNEDHQVEVMHTLRQIVRIFYMRIVQEKGE
jgi:hypothetical protein